MPQKVFGALPQEIFVRAHFGSLKNANLHPTSDLYEMYFIL